MNEWADKLVTKKKKRGNIVPKQELVDYVERTTKSNVKRLGNSTRKSIENEKKRLIKLLQDQDKQEHIEYVYKKNGIEVEANASQYGKIESVKLPYTPNEWIDLLNKEGEYLEGCCADTSRIRDILQNACRNNFHINVDDLFEAYYLAKNHGFTKDETPIGRLIKLWEDIKKDARDLRSACSANIQDPKDAFDVLYDAANTIKFYDLGFENTENERFEKHVNSNYALATVQTAINTLFFKLRDLEKEPIEGFGLIDKKGNIGHTRRGLAIFRTKEIAQEICDDWSNGKRKYSVKKMRVSMKHGIEIL